MVAATRGFTLSQPRQPSGVGCEEENMNDRYAIGESPQPTVCFGCRAMTDAPEVPDDKMPGYYGDHWETFTCERCGVQDVRLRRRD